MNAIRVKEFGGPEVLILEEVQTLQPGAAQVLVRMHAIGINPVETYIRAGTYARLPELPYTPGNDGAGVVEQVGAGLSEFKAGDRVYTAGSVSGTYAELALCKADQLHPLPPNVSFAQGAAIGTPYATAYRGLLQRGEAKPGETVLVHGASGGVGTGCVLLAKMLGAEVIACASSADKIQRLQDLGADHVINYKDTDFSKWAIEKFGKPQRRNYEGGVDVVINFTGGDTWAPTLKCVKRGGKILVCGATAGFDPKEDLRYIWSFELKVIGSNSFYDENLKALMDLIVQGKMKPVIDEVLPLAQAAHGLKLIEDREVFGKVIVCP